MVDPGIEDIQRNDPISFFKLTSADFLTTGEMIGKLDIPTLFVMEGGYGIPGTVYLLRNKHYTLMTIVNSHQLI